MNLTQTKVGVKIKERVNIVNNVKKYREESDFTQKDVAIKLGISVTGYQYIEYGKRHPNVYLALMIAEILNKSVEELFPQLHNESDIKKSETLR